MKSMTKMCVLSALTILAGCGPSATTEQPKVGGRTGHLIFDATHNNGTPGFFFLPPMVPATTYGTSFQSGLSPVVQIDEMRPGDSAPTWVGIATYTKDSGPGGVTVKEGTDHYSVNWHTKQFTLSSALTYRIRVLVGVIELGFADVDVVDSGNQLRNVASDQYIPLLDDRTFPIKFRVEPKAVSPDLCAGVVCVPFDQCHQAGACDPATGICSNPTKASGISCNDGNACTSGDVCQGGACVGGTPRVCLAMDQCHASGTCDSATGECSNPAVADGVGCIDDNFCTPSDTCQAGACVGGAPRECFSADQCHDVGTCDPLSGTCSTPQKQDTSPCNDGNACSLADTCQGGVCTGASPVACAALDQCHDVGVCDTATGSCSNPGKPDGTNCSDSSLCTQVDTCQAGSCTGANPVACVPVDQCHEAGVCHAATGLCSTGELLPACVPQLALGGQVYGLLGSGLSITDGTETLTVTNGSFQFTALHRDGDVFQVSVATQPGEPTQACEVWGGNGTFTGANVEVVVSCPVGVTPLYGAALRWNDYVRNDGPTPLDATGVPCDGTEAGPYSACVHAGETAVVVVPGQSGCAGLTATDALGAFQWQCKPGTPWVRMVSTGLAPGAGLSDLLDFGAHAWKANEVTIRDGIEVILHSTNARWHINPIHGIAESLLLQSLDSPGTVYIVPESLQARLQVGASRVALAVRPGALLTGTGGTSSTAVPVGPGVRFFWGEGAVTYVPGGRVGYALSGVRFSVLRRVSVAGGGITLADSTSNRLSDVLVTRTIDGIELDATSGLTLVDGAACVGCSITCVRMFGPNNVLSRVTSASSRIGLYIQGGGVGAGSNAVLGLTAAIDSSHSVWVTGPRTTLAGVAAVGSSAGIYFSGVGTSGRVYDAAVTDMALWGLAHETGVAVTWSGRLLLGGNSPDCKVLPGAAGVPCSTFVAPDAVLTMDSSLAPSFVGAIGSPGDAANPSDTDGTVSYSLTGIDWVTFENRQRGWGLEGVFPSAAVHGPCDTGVCRIWDWSLSSTDVIARGVLPFPSGAGATTLLHEWTVAGSGDCAAIPGATWSGSLCTSQFLARAIELTGDGVGNDNLLCEAGERCLHTPNLGAYQGHGAIEFVGVGGASGDVELYRHAENGR